MNHCLHPASPDRAGAASAASLLLLLAVALGFGLFLTIGPNGSLRDPGAQPSPTAATTARVTLRLPFDRIADPKEAAALAGARLELLHPAEGGIHEEFHAVDERGLVGPLHLAAGAWSVSAAFGDGEAWAPFVVEPIEFDLAPGDGITVDVPLVRGRQVAGLVVDGHGAPVVGASVSAGRWIAATNELGRFCFPVLLPSVGSLRITAPGFAPVELDREASEAYVRSDEAAPFVMVPGTSVDLRFTLPDGRAARNTGVRVAPASGAGAGWDVVHFADEHGVVALVDLPHTELMVTACGRTRAPGPTDVAELDFLEGGAWGEVEPEEPGERTWALRTTLSRERITAGGPIPLELAAAPTLDGQVQGLDPAAGPAAAVVVPARRFLDAFASDDLFRRGAARFPVDPSTGRFSCTLVPGRYTLLVGQAARGDDAALQQPWRVAEVASIETTGDDLEVSIDLPSPDARSR